MRFILPDDGDIALLSARASGALTSRAYWIVLVAVFAVAVLGKSLFDRGLELTCWAGGYRQDAWLAYCNSTLYGVYDAEAIWDGVEPEAGPAISSAQVLTISDSHLQNALSLGGASEWFAQRKLPFYMAGLPGEESGFGEKLIEKFHPHPAVLILDASPYFTGAMGLFEAPLFTDPKGQLRQILRLKKFQVEHQEVCSELPGACGHNFAYFRSRLDGHWIFPRQTPALWSGWRSVPNDTLRFPVDTQANELLSLYSEYRVAAKRLVALAGIPHSCVVVTQVPTGEDLHTLPGYLAAATGMTVVEPVVSGLYTFDEAHLTPESSRRWTQAFLKALEPVLNQCIATHNAPPAAG